MLSDGSALVGGSNQAGELFLNVWDAKASTSYELDLGVTLADFCSYSKNTQVWDLDHKFKVWSATNHVLTFNVAANNSYVGKNSTADSVLLSSLTGAANAYNVNMLGLIKLQNNVSARAQSINVDTGSNTNYAANLSTVTTNINSAAYFDDAFWGTAMGITGYAGSATVRNGGTNETLNLVYIHSPGGVIKPNTKAAVEYLNGHLSLDPTGSTLIWIPTLLSANKLIHGSADNDTLKAGGGNDTLTGGTGNDLFLVSSGTAVITDLGNGKDILSVGLNATATATLFAAWTADKQTSNLGTVNLFTKGFAVNVSAATGTKGFIITNTGAATALTGSANADILVAGSGSDTLTGGGGKDVFKLTTLSKVTITDFSVVDDTIQLDHSIFTKLTAIGNLNGANFKIGAPTDNNDYITYNSANGIISYDADGNGKGVATQIAVVGLHLGLTNLDFVVI